MQSDEPVAGPVFDLNLLVALDALLAEGSVTDAAERLHLSVPAASRALGRLRRVLDDPILIRAGRTMVPTPLAVALAPRVRALLLEARGLVDEGRAADLTRLERLFTIRGGDHSVAVLGPPLVARAGSEVPKAVLRFVAEGDEDVAPLRDGSVDLDLGMIRETGPEIVVEPLFEDHLVVAVAADHPLAGMAAPVAAPDTGATQEVRRPPVTLADLAAFPYVVVSRRGRTSGPFDEELARHGLARRVVAVVGNFGSAAAFLPASQTATMLPASYVRQFAERDGLRAIEVPAPLPAVPISMAWHPRHAADPGHRWLRDAVRSAAEAL